MQREVHHRRRGANLIIVLLYLVLGAYFINQPFNFVTVPDIISQYDKWIIFVGGILILFGVINYFRAKRR